MSRETMVLDSQGLSLWIKRERKVMLLLEQAGRGRSGDIGRHHHRGDAQRGRSLATRLAFVIDSGGISNERKGPPQRRTASGSGADGP
jgi:hypothetical protein